MVNTDFFDDDLIQQRDSARSIKMGPGGTPPPVSPVGDPAEALVGRAVSDLNLTRMARHKEEVEDQVARAAEELERLRQRQEDLEREKQNLEDLRRKQEDYERGKRELIERLQESVATLERDEIRASQTCELLGATRGRFKEILAELEAVDETTWEDEAIREELGKALAVIEDARIEYNKARAKIQAVASAEPVLADRKPVVFDDSRREETAERTFAQWIQIGVAISIPLAVVLAVLMGIYVFLRMQAIL